MKTIEELLLVIESKMIDAGETCVDNYQLNFDWGKYGKYINSVKKEVYDFFVKENKEKGIKND